MSKQKAPFYLLLLSYVQASPFVVTFLILTCAHIQLKKKFWTELILKVTYLRPTGHPQHAQRALAQQENTSGARSEGKGLVVWSGTVTSFSLLHVLWILNAGLFPLHRHRLRQPCKWSVSGDLQSSVVALRESYQSSWGAGTQSPKLSLFPAFFTETRK